MSITKEQMAKRLDIIQQVRANVAESGNDGMHLAQVNIEVMSNTVC